MLIDADFKQLEILCAGYLSKDKVLYGELRNQVDIHADNQARLGLPSKLVAKVFVFRIIYGGSAFSFGHDPDFAYISSSPRYWQRAIDGFYDKYKGLHEWHSSLVREVVRTKKLVIPATGRVYTFERDKRGEWPRTTILNYPVQGLGADIMCIARVSLFKRLANEKRIKFISTVHDSILLDVPSELVDSVCSEINKVWEDIPRNFNRHFGVQLDLPCKVKIKVGPNWGDMKEYTKEI